MRTEPSNSTDWISWSIASWVSDAPIGKIVAIGVPFLAGLLTLLTSGIATAQTGSVQMNFSDRTLLTNPFADSNAVKASGLIPAQESDFAPESSEPQSDDLTVDPDSPPQPDTDDAIESLQLEEAKEAEDPIDTLDSDDPVDTPTFSLSGQSNDESSPLSENNREQDAPGQSSSTQQNLNDGYQLPTVANVRAPISFAPLASTAQHDPGGLLVNDQNINFQQRFVAQNSSYAEVSGMPAAAKFKTWRAHNVYHRPTYFEDQNLELNGNQRPFQNVASAVSFFSTIPRMPYLIGEHHPDGRIYTYGQDRPGDPAPFRIYQSNQDRKGRIFQTIATLGIILP